MFRKLAVLKRILRVKRLWRTNVKFVILQCKATNFTKTRIEGRPFWRWAENSDVSAGKAPWWKLLFRKIESLESIPAVLWKTDSTTVILQYGFGNIPLFKTLENLLRGITAIPFILEPGTSLKMTCFEYIVHRTTLTLNAIQIV